MEPAFHVRILGRFSVRRAEEEIPPSAFRGRMVRTLVRILLAHRGEFVSRDLLVEALWGERPPADPDLNLNVLVRRARSALGDPSLIATGPRGYSFTGDERCQIDAEVFVRRVEAGRDHLRAGRPAAALQQFRAGLDVWGGEPFAEDAYEEWAQDHRRHLQRAHLEALEGAAAAALASDDAYQAAGFAEAAVARDPLRERSNLLLVRAFAQAGDTAGALNAFEGFRCRLAEELGIDPSPDAEKLQRRLLRGERVEAPALRPRPAPWVTPPEELEFVGREQEMVVIEEALRRDRAIVLVSGAGGTGKSRLLAQLALQVEAPVASARAYSSERDEAWSLARSLLRDLLSLDVQAAARISDRAAQALADIIPEVGELGPTGAAVLDHESRRTLAVEGAVALLRAASARRVVVVTDDLQWADATSLAVLRSLFERASQFRCVFAYRPEDVVHDTPVATLLAEAQALTDTCLTVALGPLPVEAVSRLLSGEELVRAVVEEGALSPLALWAFVRELASGGAIERDSEGRWRARSERAAALAPQAARSGQRKAIMARLQRRSPRERDLVWLLGLAGRELPARLLGAATRRPQALVLDDLDGLARGGLVHLGDQGWTTAHDVFGETLVAALSRQERGRLHDMLAHALSTEGGDAPELARHLAGAGDVDAATEAYLRGASDALRRFASEEAKRLADSGLGLNPEPRIRAQLLETRGEARGRLSDLVGAREDLQAALRCATAGPDRARLLTMLAMLRSGSEDYLRAAELIELALTEAGEDSRARAEALAAGAIMDLNSGNVARAEERSRDALAFFEELGDPRGAAAVLELRVTMMLVMGQIREALPMLDRVVPVFEDSGDLPRVITARGYRAIVLFLLDRAEEALGDIEQALDLERALGRPEGEALGSWLRSEVLAALGRLEEARASAQASFELARRVGHREWTADALTALGIVSRLSGDRDGAEALFRQALELARDMPIVSSRAAALLASVLVEGGDLAEAEGYVEQSFAEGLPINAYEARLANVELALARGDSDALAVAADALALAEAGGHLASAARIKLILGRTPALSGGTQDPVP